MTETIEELLSKDVLNNEDVSDILDFVSSISSTLEQESYIDQMKRKCNYNKTSLMKELNRLNKDRNNQIDSKQNQESSVLSVHQVLNLDKELIKKRINPISDFLLFRGIVTGIVTSHTLHTPEGDEQFVLMNDGNIFNIKDEEKLNELSLQLSTVPPKIQSRWSHESIVNFVNKRKKSQITSVSGGVFFEIDSLLHDYIELSEGEASYKLISIWIIGTYFHRLFKGYPYLFLNGTKASGKTKTLEFANMLSFNSFLSAGMSTSSLFRMIESLRPSMLIDESESLNNKERRESFRELLLSGYKNGAKTYRSEEKSEDGVKKFEVREFDLYCPKMLANITGLEEVLESRCISLTMKSALNQTIANREVDINDPIWSKIRDDLYNFMHDNWDRILDLYNKIENDGTFKNREWELWRPMLSIAWFFGEDYRDQLLEYAKIKVEESREQDRTNTNEHMILYSLYLNINKESEYYHVSDIRSWVKQHFEFDDNVSWLTPRFIGRILARLGFKNKRRVSRGIEYRIDKKDVDDLANRMNLVVPVMPDKDEEKEEVDEQTTL